MAFSDINVSANLNPRYTSNTEPPNSKPKMNEMDLGTFNLSDKPQQNNIMAIVVGFLLEERELVWLGIAAQRSQHRTTIFQDQQCIHCNFATVPLPKVSSHEGRQTLTEEKSKFQVSQTPFFIKVLWGATGNSAGDRAPFQDIFTCLSFPAQTGPTRTFTTSEMLQGPEWKWIHGEHHRKDG